MSHFAKHKSFFSGVKCTNWIINFMLANTKTLTKLKDSKQSVPAYFKKRQDYKNTIYSNICP